MLGFGKKASLKGQRVAILTTDGVEHTALTLPWRALKKAGAEVYVIGPKLGTLQTVKKLLQEDRVPIDAALNEVRPGAFGALLLPGSTYTFKQLKGEHKAIEFVRAFVRSGKPIAAIGAAPGLLALAGPVRGQRLTSSLELRPELEHAGALWLDQAVVIDEQILTSRGPQDLKAVIKQLVPHFAAHVMIEY